jgi:hypothetical protein
MTRQPSTSGLCTEQLPEDIARADGATEVGGKTGDRQELGAISADGDGRLGVETLVTETERVSRIMIPPRRCRGRSRGTKRRAARSSSEWQPGEAIQLR